MTTHRTYFVTVLLTVFALAVITVTPPAFADGTTRKSRSARIAGEDMAQALFAYLSLGYEVFQTPNFAGNLKPNGVYSLENMEVSAIFKNEGVVIWPAGEKSISSPPPLAILYTTKKYQVGSQLQGSAKFTGVKAFRTSIGDEKQMPTFKAQ